MRLHLFIYAVLISTLLIGCEDDKKQLETTSKREDSTTVSEALTDTVNLASQFAHIDSTEIIKQVQNYLFHFGYLDIEGKNRNDSLTAKANLPRSKGTGNLDSGTISSIKSFQKFFGLSETGQIDNKTLQNLQAPRCGVSDISSAGVNDNKWTISLITYGLAHKGMMVGGLSYGDVISAINLAYKIWSDATFFRFINYGVTPNDLPPVYRNLYSHSGILALPMDGPSNVLAYAYFPYGEGAGLAGDIRYDGNEHWSTATPTPAGAIDLMTVTAHEIGHTLGLNHTTDPTSLMYPNYLGPHRFLSPADLQAFKNIYNRVK